jgi:hypothetical protein
MRAGLRQVGIRGIFLSHRLRGAGSLKHMALAVDPSMRNVLNDEGNEQTSDHDGSRSSLIFDALNAVVIEEELGVCEKLYPVSGCLETAST